MADDFDGGEQIAHNTHVLEVLQNITNALAGLQNYTLRRIARLEQALEHAGIELPEVDGLRLPGTDVDDLLAEIAELTDGH